jgi:nucleoside-diphosphate-sugar epimerase
MTALAGKANLRKFDTWFATTNRLRTAGTRHLLAAAEAAGVEKFVAQSYTGWSNVRTGGPVKTEDDPLDPHPARNQEESMACLQFLEQAVQAAPQGIVLRYGNFYGPGASEEMVELVRKRQLPIIGDGAGVWSWIHLEGRCCGNCGGSRAGPARCVQHR